MTQYKFPDYTNFIPTDADRLDTNRGHIGLVLGDRANSTYSSNLIFSKKYPSYFLSMNRGSHVGGGNDGIVPVPRRRNATGVDNLQPTNYDLATNPTTEEFSPPTQSLFSSTDSENTTFTHDTIIMGEFNLNRDLYNQSENPDVYYILKADDTFAYVFNDCRREGSQFINDASCNLSEVYLAEFVKHKNNRPDIICVAGQSRYPVQFDPLIARTADGTETRTSIDIGKTINFWKIDYNNQTTIKLDFDHVEAVTYEVPPGTPSNASALPSSNIQSLSYHGGDNSSSDNVSTTTTSLTPGWSDNIATRKVEAILADEQQDIVYLIYDKAFGANGSGADIVSAAKIVAVDISDVTDIKKIAEYVVDSGDNSRMDTIANVILDENNSIIFFTTSNGDGLHDTIKGIYFDKASQTFSQRCSYNPNPRTNYTCLERHTSGSNELLYAGNNVYKDSSNNDTLRNQTGLSIFSLSNNFQSVILNNIHQLPSVWNGNDLPIDSVDFGFVSRSPTVPYLIRVLDNNLLYVVYNKAYQWLTNADGSTIISRRKADDIEYIDDRTARNIRNLIYIYEIEEEGTQLVACATSSQISVDSHSEPRPFRMLGKDPISSDGSVASSYYEEDTVDGVNYAPLYSPFTSLPSPVAMLLERDLTRGEMVLLHQGLSGHVGKLQLDRLITVDRTNLNLIQEFNYEDTPYSLDYYSSYYIDRSSEKQLMAVANGSQGVKIYFWRSSSNSWQPLTTLRPSEDVTRTVTDEDGNETTTTENEYAKMTKVLVFSGGYQTNQNLRYLCFICFSEQNIYNYAYDEDDNSIDLVQTIKYSDISSLATASQLYSVLHANISDHRKNVPSTLTSYPRLNFFINIHDLTVDETIVTPPTPSNLIAPSPPPASAPASIATGTCSYCVTIRSTKEYAVEGSTFNRTEQLLADCRAAAPVGNGSENCAQCQQVISSVGADGVATHYKWQKGIRICSSKLIGTSTVVDNTMCTKDTGDFMNIFETGCAEYFDANRFSGSVFNVYNCEFEEGGTCEGLDQSSLL